MLYVPQIKNSRTQVTFLLKYSTKTILLVRLKVFEKCFLLIKLGYVTEKRTFYDLSSSKFAKKLINSKGIAQDLDTTFESEDFSQS